MRHILTPKGSRSSTRQGSVLRSLVTAIVLLSTLPAVAAEDATRDFEPEFRSLGLGQTADQVESEGYEGFACGSDGGPPLEPIDGWTDYMQCEPGPHGLHEVYVEFGGRTERMSELFHEQQNEELWLQQFGGTRVANFPVIMSLLFDDAGVVRGFRAVTDSRAANRDRGAAYLLRFRIYPLYGSEGWDCTNRDPHDGRAPVGDTYLEETCTKTLDGKYVRVEAHFYRRAGQSGVDYQGQYRAGEYESMTRWEVFDASLPDVP